MPHSRFFLAVVALSLVAARASAQHNPARVEVSPSKPRPTDGTLGTTFYEPTKGEKELTQGWTKKELASNAEDIKSLQAFTEMRVAWFGIVREVAEDAKQNETNLLVEMKYFDGLTDTHLQIVSIAGAGDFRAVVPGVGHKIPKLSLVRIYGKVEENPKAAPMVRADYVRVWNWGDFAFMAYGEDKSNPQWVKLRKVSPLNVYSSSPNNRYYEARLGPR